MKISLDWFIADYVLQKRKAIDWETQEQKQSKTRQRNVWKKKKKEKERTQNIGILVEPHVK